MTGKDIEKSMEVMDKKTIADLQKLITGLELNNANFCGSAEVPEHAKEEDGAVDLMDVI